MGYRQGYYELIDRLKKICIEYYGKRLISLVIFGSVAKDSFRPDSDIDVLIIADDLPKGRIKRVSEFTENIEVRLSDDIKSLSEKNIFPYFSPVIKSKEEVMLGSPLFLDMTEDVKILYDADNFFENYLSDLRDKMKRLGSRKVYFKGGYYWLLKPDYKYGDIIEL